MNDCLFCKIAHKEIPSYALYEDEKTMVFLNIYPYSKGHALIVPKAHASNLSEGSQEYSVALMNTLYTFAPKLMKALGATAYNLGMNHGVDAGQEIFHTHLHVIPRYKGQPRSFEKTTPTLEELEALQKEILSVLS